MSTQAKATAAWAGALPDWVRVLAEACDETSLRKVAAQLDVSPASVSLAIGGKRKNLEFIKARVESTLMAVTCPVLGVIGTNECLREQAAEFTGANPLCIQLYRACRGGCKHFKSKEKIA